MPDRPPVSSVPGNRWTEIPVPDAWDPTRPVSVILPYYEAPEPLARTLAGLAAQNYPAELVEVIVVDDGSNPPLEMTEPGVTVIHQEDRGFGLARARNTGAAAASGEILVFLDSDMVPERGWLTAHAGWHHVVADAVVNGFRRHVDFDGLAPDAVEEAVARESLDELLAGRQIDEPEWIDFHMARTDELNAGHHDAFRAITGGNLSVRADVFAGIGGFDESFTRWGTEDTEFAYRAYVDGAILIPERAALAWHQGRGATPDEQEQASLAIQRDKIASLIAHESFRPLRPRRSYLVPRTVVVVHAGDDPLPTIGTVDSVLDSDTADVAVVIESEAPGERLRERYRGEPRIAVAGAGAGAGSHPHAWMRVDVVAGTRLGAGTISRLLDEIEDVGLVSVRTAEGGELVARLGRAWNRARRVAPDDPLGAIDRLFGSRTIAWQDAGLAGAATGEAGLRSRLADPTSRTGKLVRYFASARSPSDLFRIFRWMARRARRRLGG